nr:GNVR domain-containing protein [Anaerosalibacter massiliensis]
MEKVKEIMKVENIQVIDRAQEPEEPIKPRPKLNMAIAGVLGLMISIFLVFILEYLDNTIKTPDDVEYHLGLPIIGTIPKMDN